MADIYVDKDSGDDGTGDGSSGNPYATISKALDSGIVSAGDTIYVKKPATGGYTETATIDVYGSATAGIRVIGYGSTITDNVKVTIDGAATRTNCVTSSVGNGNMYYLWANFIFDDATGDGFDTVGGDNISFVNCEFTNNGDRGFQGDNFATFILCKFSGNTTSAIDADGGVPIIACSSDCNGAGGFQINDGCCFLTEIYNLGASNDGITIQGNLQSYIANITVDGENAATTTGINYASASYDVPHVVNCILHDVATGVSVTANLDNVLAVVNTIFSSVTTEYGTNTGRFELNKSTSTPGFTNEASDDYTIAAAGAAEDAGVDASNA